MTTQKKLLMSLAVVFAMALMVSSPASADFALINEATGFDSVNDIIANLENEFESVAVNDEWILNDGPVVTDTGNNFSDFNTGLTAIVSGDAAIAGGFDNHNINSNLTQYLDDFAGDFEAINSGTGAESLNSAVIGILSEVEVENLNDAWLDNFVDVFANTGNNSATFDTGGTQILTGDAGIETLVANIANANFTEIVLGANGDLLAGSSCTGFDSENLAVIDLVNEVEVANANFADLNNYVDVIADTGDNDSSFNSGGFDGCGASCGTDGSMIGTGDAITEVAIANKANENNTAIAAAFGGGVIAATNNATGAESLNSAFAAIENELEVENLNDADIDNDVLVAANTGNNEASFNEGGVGILSGGAGTAVSINNNNINNNLTEIASGVGAGVVGATNSLTGFGSVNDAVAVVENELEVENENYADIDNNVEADSNTGCNTADFNLGGSAIATGNAQTGVAITNNVNTNATAISTGSAPDVAAGNSMTGAFSVNTATAVYENEIEVENVNNADIENNTFVAANTGNNDSSFNTGGGAISTGGSAVTFGVVNNANNNIVQVNGGN